MALNLGWLVRHASEVRSISLTRLPDGRALLVVKLDPPEPNGCRWYQIVFASYVVCVGWLNRSRALRGVLVDNCGEEQETGACTLHGLLSSS